MDESDRRLGVMALLAILELVRDMKSPDALQIIGSMKATADDSDVIAAFALGAAGLLQETLGEQAADIVQRVILEHPET